MQSEYCQCGGVVLADTEDWPVPLCYECYTLTPEFAADRYDHDFCTLNKLKRWFSGTYSDSFLAGVTWAQSHANGAKLKH